MTAIREQLAARADELLQAAWDGTMTVLKNKDAPPTSTASATGNALKLYEILAGDGASDQEPSEMSYDELQRAINKLGILRQGEPDETDE